MPIQTSQITTETNGNLSISPNGTGETLITSVDVTRADSGTTEDTMVAVAADGTVKKVDLSTLPEVTSDNLATGDRIAVQKADGDFYFVQAEDLGGTPTIDPSPGGNATLVLSPTPSSGSGTSADPYILAPLTVNSPGGTINSTETFSISGAPAGSILYITATANGGGRFLDQVKTADASGNIASFSLTYLDSPASTAGAVYTATVRFGTASIYVQWAVTQVANQTSFNGSNGTTAAPNASPASVNDSSELLFGTGSGTWADGSKTLSSTGAIEFQVNSSGFGSGPTSVSDGDTVEIRYVQSSVDSASDGATVTGTLSSSDSGYTQTFDFVKDISPDAISFNSSTNAAGGSTQTSATETPVGYNSSLSVSAGTAGSNEMSNIQVSIDGGSFVSLPQTMVAGQSLTVRGDVGSGTSTTYTANINVGGTAAVFSATTSASTPTIQKPTITSPVDASTDLVPDVSVASDTYVGNNSPGPHTSSDWEVYEADFGGDVTSWSRATQAEANDWKAIAYGGGKYVALAGSGTNQVMYSTDSINWSSATATQQNNWASITYGNGMFVAVSEPGGNPEFMYSTDGISWTQANAPTYSPSPGYQNWLGVAYGNGRFVAVARDGYPTMVAYSDDAINWTHASIDNDFSWSSVTYGNGQFVAVAETGTFVGGAQADNGRSMYSSDGINWSTDSSRSIPEGGWKDVTYGNGTFVAVAGRSGPHQAMYSTDGINWTSTSVPENSAWEAVAYGEEMFVAVATDGTKRVMYSADGITWTLASQTGNNIWQAICWGDGKFVAVSHWFQASVAQVMGATWIGPAPAKPNTEPPDSAVYTQVVNDAGDTTNLTSYTLTNSVVGLGKAYYARVKYNDDGSTGSTVSSDFSDYNEFTTASAIPVPDGWTSASTAEQSDFKSVAYGNGKYVTVAHPGGNQISYSSDGISWTAVGAPESNKWWNVAYGDDRFVAVSEDGTNRVMYSTDGISWTAVPGSSQSWYDVAYGDGKWVAVAYQGNGGTMVSSDSGLTWSRNGVPENNSWYSVTYGNGKFVAVSANGTNRSMYSTDGVNWTAASTPDGDWRAVIYAGGKFVAVGDGGTHRAMYSTDGITWTSATAAGSGNSWQKLAYGNGNYVAIADGGNDSSLIMYSTDAITWTGETPPEINIWKGLTYGDDKFVSVASSGTNRAMYTFV